MARLKETDKRTVHESKILSVYDFNTDLKSLSEEIAELRQEYGDNASLSFEYSYGWYDSINIEVELTWERLETDDEVAKRIEKNRKSRETAKKNRVQKKKEDEAKEIADLKELIAKHPELAKECLS